MNMSLNEIADDMGITKACVQQNLKKALTKVWDNMRKLYPNTNALDKMVILSKMFNIFHEDDFEIFLRTFPIEIQNEVKTYIFKNIKC